MLAFVVFSAVVLFLEGCSSGLDLCFPECEGCVASIVYLAEDCAETDTTF